MQSLTKTNKYRLSFTGASLQLTKSAQLAELYLHHKDWAVVKQEVVKENLLQKNKAATITREFRELRKRLEKLTQAQLDYLVDASASEQRLLLFLGVCKLYSFIGDFVIEVLRRKVLTFEPILQESDYLWFYQMKTETHPELEDITESTQKKIRSRLFWILEEAGLINNVKDKWIIPPMVTNALAQPIITENSALLKYLLVSDTDIKRFKNGL